MSAFDELVTSLDETSPFTEEDVAEAMQSRPASKSPKRGRPRKTAAKEDSVLPDTKSPKETKKGAEPRAATEAVIKRVKAYKDSPVFKDRLAHVQVWDEMSLEEAQKAYKQCLQQLSHSFNRSMVKQIFCKTISLSETAMVHYLNVHHAKGISDELLSEESMKNFNDELEELALELDNHYQPGPLVRLVGKVAVCVADSLESRLASSAQAEVPLEVDIGLGKK